MINVIDEEENIHPVTFSDELNHKILNHLADFKSVNGNWTWTNENSPYMLTRKFSKSEFDQQLHNRYYLKFTMNKIVREIFGSNRRKPPAAADRRHRRPGPTAGSDPDRPDRCRPG